MTDLIFDHTKSDMFGALGVKQTDLKKFFVDVEDYMKDRRNKHSEALEFIWSSDQSFEMKIAATFALGGLVGQEKIIGQSATVQSMPLSVLRDLMEQLKKDGLL